MKVTTKSSPIFTRMKVVASPLMIALPGSEDEADDQCDAQCLAQVSALGAVGQRLSGGAHTLGQRLADRASHDRLRLREARAERGTTVTSSRPAEAATRL